MARYQVLVEYVGTNFRGWQIQKKGSTIQGLIQLNLSKLLKEKITLNGSGRTDAGVHAYAQSAHFDCKRKILDLTTFLHSINYFLNATDIEIIQINKRSEKSHTIYSAHQILYIYIILNQIITPVLKQEIGWQEG